MDVQSGLVCALVFVVSAILLLVISKFGIREKSYEEALAEQRKLTSGLLGTANRAKSSKEKKQQKKAGKKVKEKSPAPVPAPTQVEIESTEESEQKLHVAFEEPPVETIQIDKVKRTKKDKVVKPILVNKEKPVETTTTKPPNLLNHFDKIQPKDEFQLHHSYTTQRPPQQQQKDQVQEVAEVQKVKSNKMKLADEPQQQQPQQQGKSFKPNNKDTKTEKNATPDQGQVAEPAVKEQQLKAPVVLVKDKKKKKSEFNTLQQLAAGNNDDVGLLVALVRKAELSRSEIQILIDLLLNKQHEAPAIIDQWTEGRADPVQKLKKQLADKEKALEAEQEALASAQAKLREIRTELNQERSRLTHNCRNLEENLHAKRTEIQTAAARLHTQSQQIQQLQVQLNEESMKSRALTDEVQAMQLQRQQLDMHLNQQKQDTEATYQSQLSGARAELQEAQARNAQLTLELHQIRAEKEMLHDRVRQIETHYKNDLDQQLEESRRMYNELEHRFNLSQRNENELKMVCQQHLEEARRHEVTHGQAHEEIGMIREEINRLNSIHKQAQDEHQKLVIQLKNQIQVLENEKDAINGSISNDKEIQILNLQNELISLRADLKQRESQLKTDLDSSQRQIQQLENELMAQKNKNDVTVKNIIADTEEKYKQFLLRLFPSLNVSGIQQENWWDTVETEIRKYLQTVNTEAHSVEVSKLNAELKKYKATIEDTDAMLIQIQNEISSEEARWRQEIQNKDEEIERLTASHKTQLKAEIANLEKQLQDEQYIRQQLQDELATMKVNQVSVSPSANLVSIEELMEEKCRLAENLTRTQHRCQELSEEVQSLRMKDSVQTTKTVQNHTNGTIIESSEVAQVTN